MGLFVLRLPISFVMIDRMHVLIIIIISEVWPICYCLGSGDETILCLHTVGDDENTDNQSIND